MLNLKTVSIGTVAAGVVAFGALYAISSLTTVPAGYVGVRVNLYADKGVDN